MLANRLELHCHEEENKEAWGFYIKQGFRPCDSPCEFAAPEGCRLLVWSSTQDARRDGGDDDSGSGDGSDVGGCDGGDGADCGHRDSGDGGDGGGSIRGDGATNASDSGSGIAHGGNAQTGVIGTGDAEEQRDLHRRGLEVVKNAMRLSDATKRQVHRSDYGEELFNKTTPSGNVAPDGLRQQTTGDPEWTPGVRAELEGLIRAQGVLRCSQGEKSLARLVAIRSLPRKHHRKKHQPRHADSAERNSLRSERPEDVPLACIVALQNGTRLHVWPFDTGKEEVIVLDEGDMLLFRGDLGHAGAEYDEENWRLHVYIDSPVIERQTHEDGATLTFPF
jgi:hypothetical protein